MNLPIAAVFVKAPLGSEDFDKIVVVCGDGRVYYADVVDVASPSQHTAQSDGWQEGRPIPDSPRWHGTPPKNR